MPKYPRDEELGALVAEALETEYRAHGEVLDEIDHQAKYQSATVDTRREQELRIQALGAAISRRDWNATERAYETIRDKFCECVAINN